jgi:sporulation protein YlmC with PRC-barrel domain
MPLTNDSLVNNWIGRSVRNSAGETIGKIEDLIIDPSNGAVSFAVLSLGGLLAARDKLAAIPFRKLTLIPSRDYVLLDVDKNVLADAPMFERSRWPDTTDPAWRSQIYTHYGYSDPVVVRDRPVVVDREYRAPRKEMSALAAVFLVLLLIAGLGFAYLVATRGWEQARADLVGSMHGVTYAMKDVSSDAALTAKVKTALSLNRRIPANTINVDSKNGVVTLRGEVNDDETRTAAVNIAQDTPGVQEVHDHLYVISRGK